MLVFHIHQVNQKKPSTASKEKKEKNMTIYTAPVESFLAENTTNITRQLAENIITNFGGETQFLKEYSAVNQDGILDGFGSYIYFNEMSDFYNKNKADIITVVLDAAKKHNAIDIPEFLYRAFGLSDFTIDEVTQGFIDRDNADEPNNYLRNVVVSWMVQLVAEQFCDHYSSYADTETA